MSLFSDFARSTSRNRTGTVTSMCLVCGKSTSKIVEVNDFNVWSFEHRYPGKDGYTSSETFRHRACMVEGYSDFAYLHTPDTGPTITPSLDIDLEFPELDLDFL